MTKFFFSERKITIDSTHPTVTTIRVDNHYIYYHDCGHFCWGPYDLCCRDTTQVMGQMCLVCRVGGPKT